MKKDTIFLPFMGIILAVGILLGGTMAYTISGPMTEVLSAIEKRPLQMVANEVYAIPAGRFHTLLNERKEDDPLAVEAAKRDVLAQIGVYYATAHPQEYHFMVLDENGALLVDSGNFFAPDSLPSPSSLARDGEVTIRDREGRILLGYHRFFPAWRWHILTLIHEGDLGRETMKVKLWIYGSGTAGFSLLMLAFYLLVRRRIQKPLQILVAHAHELMQGRYGIVPVAGRGEVADLLVAFNRMTEAIRDRERRLIDLARFTESSPNIIMKVAPDGSVLYANRSVPGKLAELGFPSCRPELLLPPDTPSLIRKIGETEGRKTEITLKVGERIVEYAIFGFVDEDGVVFHGVDVTEKKAMEERLLHTQKMEILGRTAGGVAHDFNNLLAGILGYASLLKQTPFPDPATARALDSIERAAERGSQLTRQLLSFARKGTHEYLNTDINRIIDEVADIVSKTFMKSIAVRKTLDADLPSVNGDSTQLHQCLMNLCINARDAMPEGGTLGISTRRRTLDEDICERYYRVPAGLYVSVTVVDEGHGMDAATLARIYDPFFTTKEDKGTGLGMSMVYGIVKSHGGFIDVQSEPGKGTSVEILLPATGEHPAEAPAHAAPPVAAFRDGATGTVLLVDDEEFVRDVAEAMLSSLGYMVLTASNGREGVELFRREKDRIRFTIMDLMMPVMDGRKAFEAIRRIDPGACVVISTGYSGDEDVDNLKAMGVSAILPKPYSFRAMGRMVAELEGLPDPEGPAAGT